MSGSASGALRQAFHSAVGTPAFGGAAVLARLGRLAQACVDGTSAERDAVAFALSTVFSLHAEDRTERIVTGDDTYSLVASGLDHLSKAIEFIESGAGTATDAIKIVAALAHLIPDKLRPPG